MTNEKKPLGAMNQARVLASMSASLVVADRAPHLIPIFDAIVRTSRALMDSSSGSEELFAADFQGKADVINLMPTNDKEFSVVSLVSYNITAGLKELSPVKGIDPEVEARLVSGVSKPQQWQLRFCDTILAEKTLADRSVWGKLPEGAKPPVPDGNWNFTKLAIEQFVENGDPGFMTMLDLIFSNAMKLAESVLEATKQADYQARAQALKNAKWGGAFAKKAGAVQSDQFSPSVDVGALMGRISSESKKFKPN